MKITSKVFFAVGTIHPTNNCGDIKVIEFISPKQIKVRFEKTGFETVTQGSALKMGNIKDRFVPSIIGVGFLGVGKYKPTEGKPSKPTKTYIKWVSILARCYDENNGNYRGCGEKGITVCKEWFNFQTYAKWLESVKPEGLYEIVRDRTSNIFSPETCSVKLLINKD